MSKIGVILLNMGGPTSLEGVREFLYNLFSDHDIIEIPRVIQKPLAYMISTFRAKKTLHYYEIMGGKSPQNEQTFLQAKALQDALGNGYKVVVGMRYFRPFIKDAIEELLKENINRVILLPMYPQYSKTTTGSSFKEFDRQAKNLKLEVRKVRDYHDHPLYIKAMVENIKESLPNYKDFVFLFSAHSLPLKVIKQGDPYKDQIEKTVSLIMESFKDVEYYLGYQSKVGPVKWLSPMTDELIDKLAKRGVKNLCVIPVAFTCEHSETLYEIDNLYKNLALDLGIKNFVRVKTLQTHPTYIEALKNIVLSQSF